MIVGELPRALGTVIGKHWSVCEEHPDCAMYRVDIDGHEWNLCETVISLPNEPLGQDA